MSRKSKKDVLEVSSHGLLGLVADIRAAVGDPKGKLMQDELVAHCRSMRSALEKLATAESSGDWVQDLRCIKAIARMGLGLPNAYVEAPNA
jgi:hypothetical protein